MIHLLDDKETRFTFVGRSHGMIDKFITQTCFASMNNNQYTSLPGNRNYKVTRVVATKDVSIEEAIETHIHDETNMRGLM